ncbi:ABC transporter ATP-binding protein [Paenibacillus beijingensis]|uniref:ABC transporter ATP-binding protein n=1 Tax=Paenibacillus beijingensis TaxID=1126833 RepID=A0A0D5NES7_9BACL|nr:ABC transporter ATP-binding protein [Paenibacillus beijingensis]AJY73736.1 ABC transporter ATP-binding protein [Paenibacillus beijingensis]
MADALLEMRNITKVYPNGVVANQNVHFSLYDGEIHAVAGENGAGKSTLMKMMFGMEEPSEGDIYLRGNKVKLHTPQDAIALGIGMVHQHFMLVNSFTVAENMVLGMEPKKGIAIDYREAVRLTKEYSAKYNLQVDPAEKVENLSVGMKQKVEILKALVRGARILILDEPTAVLTPQETEELFGQLKLLKESGHTVVFISHKLKEVKAICDRITIMRSGRTEGIFDISEVSEQEISRLMVGRDVVLKYEKTSRQPGEKVLQIDDFTCSTKQGKPILSRIRLSIRKGEIVGIAGVEGNGQSQLVEAVTGRLEGDSGTVEVNGTAVGKLDIEAIRGLGVSYIPEDRMRQGTAREASILDNLISTRYKHKEWSRFGWLKRTKMMRLTESQIADFQIKTSGPTQEIGMLSGGNMQKVVVARESSTDPQLLIAEQPTRGVDVGAAQLIHRKLLELRSSGCAILLISADLNEILELSDSLLVMYEGEIVAHFDKPSEITEQELGLYMLGIKRQDEVRGAVND